METKGYRSARVHQNNYSGSSRCNRGVQSTMPVQSSFHTRTCIYSLADPIFRLDALSCLQHNEGGIILKMFAAMLRCGACQ